MSNEKISYSIAEACAATGISRSGLYVLIAAQRVETRKLGRRTLIPASSLKRLLDL